MYFFEYDEDVREYRPNIITCIGILELSIQVSKGYTNHMWGNTLGDGGWGMGFGVWGWVMGLGIPSGKPTIYSGKSPCLNTLY